MSVFKKQGSAIFEQQATCRWLLEFPFNLSKRDFLSFQCLYQFGTRRFQSITCNRPGVLFILVVYFKACSAKARTEHPGRFYNIDIETDCRCKRLVMTFSNA